MPGRWLVLMLLAAGVELRADVCAVPLDRPACELYQEYEDVFTATLIDDFQFSPQDTVSRVRILDSFRGTNAAGQEIFIQQGLRSGKTYLFSFDARPHTIGEFLKLAKRFRMPQSHLPEVWRGKERLPFFSIRPCGSVEELPPGAPMIAELREAARDKSGYGSILGMAMYGEFYFDRFEESPPVADAEVRVRGNGRVWELRTDREGKFEIHHVPLGNYSAVIVKEKSKLAKNVEVTLSRSGACAVVRGDFAGTATIEGQLIASDRLGTDDISITAYPVSPTGKLFKAAAQWADTGKNGFFRLENVPDGRVLVGVNAGGVAPARFRPVEWSATSGQGRMLQVSAGQAIKGVTLRLPERLRFGYLYLDVLDVDGTPHKADDFVVASRSGWNRVDERGKTWPHTNRVYLELVVGHTYDIRMEGYEGALRIRFKGDMQVATLQLGKKRAGARKPAPRSRSRLSRHGAAVLLPLLPSRVRSR